LLTWPTGQGICSNACPITHPTPATLWSRYHSYYAVNRNWVRPLLGMCGTPGSVHSTPPGTGSNKKFQYVVLVVYPPNTHPPSSQLYVETHPPIIWMGKTHCGRVEISMDGYKSSAAKAKKSQKIIIYSQ